MPYQRIYRRLPGSQYYNQRVAATRIQAVVRRKQQQKSYKNLKLAKPVAALVQRRIDSSNPSKHKTFHQRRYQFTNLISDAPLLRLHTVIPSISLGVERHDRIGAKVQVKYCNVKGRISIPADDNPLIGNDDRAQIYVRMMVLSTKQKAQLSEVIQIWNSTLNDQFFKNDSQPFAPTGNYIDMLSHINREVFTVHHDKVMRLDRQYPFFPDPTSTSGAAAQIPVSKDFSINLKMKNKILDYAQPSSVQPQNYQPFLCCLFAYGNGSPPSTSAVPFIEYLSSLSFKE